MQKFESLLSINVLNVSTESQFTILSLNMSYAVLTVLFRFSCDRSKTLGIVAYQSFYYVFFLQSLSLFFFLFILPYPLKDILGSLAYIIIV